ncbi:MAG: hypothetical protein AABY22_07640 [Nanoarchaeota archaeon]
MQQTEELKEENIGKIDLEDFFKVDKGDFKKEHNLKKIVIAFVGSFSYTKGAMNVLKAAKKSRTERSG